MYSGRYIYKRKIKTRNQREDGLASKDVHIIECICPEDIVLSRLRQRKQDYSDADFSVYRKMKRIYEPVKVEHMTVDTSMLSKTDIRSIATKILKEDK